MKFFAVTVCSIYLFIFHSRHIQYWLREYNSHERLTKNNKNNFPIITVHWFHHRPLLSLECASLWNNIKEWPSFSTATWWIIDGWVRDYPYVIFPKKMRDFFVLRNGMDGKYNDKVDHAVLNRIISFPFNRE